MGRACLRTEFFLKELEEKYQATVKPGARSGLGFQIQTGRSAGVAACLAYGLAGISLVAGFFLLPRRLKQQLVQEQKQAAKASKATLSFCCPQSDLSWCCVVFWALGLRASNLCRSCHIARPKMPIASCGLSQIGSFRNLQSWRRDVFDALVLSVVYFVLASQVFPRGRVQRRWRVLGQCGCRVSGLFR